MIFVPKNPDESLSFSFPVEWGVGRGVCAERDRAQGLVEECDSG